MSSQSSLFQRIGKIPVAVLPTLVGAITLSNVFANPLGYTWVRHLTIWIAAVVWMVYLFKIIYHFPTVLEEYKAVVPSSLYAGFFMLLMLVASYLFDYLPTLGKTLWLIAIFLHAIHILIFTYNHVLKGVKIETFVPSWFVTYNGIMVSTVVGAPMKEPLLCSIIVYYGIIILAILMPFMIYRLLKHPIKDAFYHTRAILLAPSSLCLVSYINIIERPQAWLIYVLYFIVFCCLIFVVLNINKFFAYSFHPGFAGLTFPMAIGIVASIKMAQFLTKLGYLSFGGIITQISGFQIYLTTTIIAYVLHNFYILLFKQPANK